MPFLVQEPNIYPDQLFDGPPLDVPDRCWWVLYTKARQEKGLARFFVDAQMPFFLPLIRRTHVHRGGRERDSFVPLFAGYIFLFGNNQERIQALTSNRISRVLEVLDGPELQHDLAQVHRLIASDAPLSVESRLSPGDRVRVKHGGFKDMEGTVERRRTGCRLIVAIRFIQQAVSVEIDDFLLEPLEKPR